MEQYAASKLARRASPYGLAILPEKEIFEYTDPRNEAAVERRWRPICERLGAAVLGIRDVPTGKVRVQLDGIPWELEPVGMVERTVPAEVFHLWRALEAAGVPLLYWFWGEEQPARPRFRPLPEIMVTRPTRWAERLATVRDPIVIGVIPTAPGRGVWVLIGRWFH